MDKSFKIRIANNEDGVEVLNLVEQVLSDYGLRINPSETDKDLSDLDDYYFSKNGWFAVIEKDGRIIGSYGLFKINEKTCELRKMYLQPVYQGHGLGKLMLTLALNKAKELGYSEMILESNKSLGKALVMYEKYGFERYKPAHMSDRCDVAMRKKL